MQFAVVKGRAREIAPLVIVAWTQGVACVAWVVFFLVSGRAFVPPGAAWPAIAASSLLVIGMSGLLARASARGDISIVGPILALSPIFTILPDAALSGGWPSALGWVGLALSLAGTVSLSGGPGSAGLLGRVRVLFARRDALDALGAAFFLGFLAAVDRWAALAIGPPSYLVSSHGTTFAQDCGAGRGFMLTLFLRDGDDVYRTYNTTQRGVDRLLFVNNMLDLAPYGRQ